MIFFTDTVVLLDAHFAEVLAAAITLHCAASAGEMVAARALLFSALLSCDHLGSLAVILVLLLLGKSRVRKLVLYELLQTHSFRTNTCCLVEFFVELLISFDGFFHRVCIENLELFQTVVANDYLVLLPQSRVFLSEFLLSVSHQVLLS